MNVDLIDMNAFVMDDEEEVSEPSMGWANNGAPQATKASYGSDTNHSDNSGTMGDFLEDDEVALRDHTEARVLITTPIANPYN